MRWSLLKSMKLFPLIILVGIIALSFHSVYAQEELMEDYDSIAERILLKKEMTGGATLHTLGMGANFRKGVNKSYFTSRIFEVEVVSMKHPKQVKVIAYYTAKSFVYGKLNHVYMLRAGYGYKKLLNRKPYWGGVELRALYMGGASIAFAKPVYLYFYDLNYQYRYEEKYDPEKPAHSSEFIYGRAPFTDGIWETKIYPGVYAKGALNFEFGKLNTKIRALEVGGVVEFFPIAVPIMAYRPKHNVFATFYLNFSFGKRYN